jgi:hypothetical protein
VGRDELARAVGRVALASAANDETLRRILWEESGADDLAWILFEGQSTSWLLDGIRAVMSLQNAPPDTEFGRLHARVIESLRKVSGLYAHRNAVIHGDWRLTESPWDGIQVVPRPWGEEGHETIWYCHRSRIRDYKPPSAWTVGDIHSLADRIESASSDAMKSYAALHTCRYGPDSNSYWMQFRD